MSTVKEVESDKVQNVKSIKLLIKLNNFQKSHTPYKE